jgi:16S rRNA (guanine527-N7)-methyltransferase
VSEPIEALGGAIEQVLGRPAARREIRQFSRYLELLRRWNRTHRLTGVQTPEAIIEKLFKDSLLFIPLLPPRPLKLIDIGAGAGIPGLPLRIVDPAIEVTLVESRRKRVSFLATVVRELGLTDVRILHGRAEAMIQEEPDLEGKFDVAALRGVPLRPELTTAIVAYLRPGGRLLAAGPPRARIELAKTGMEIREVSYPGFPSPRMFLLLTREA